VTEGWRRKKSDIAIQEAYYHKLGVSAILEVYLRPIQLEDVKEPLRSLEFPGRSPVASGPGSVSSHPVNSLERTAQHCAHVAKAIAFLPPAQIPLARARPEWKDHEPPPPLPRTPLPI
jgi:hypothetical protein